MELTCLACTNGTASDGNPCVVCGGDGAIKLTDADINKYPEQRRLHGRVWNEILTRLADIEDKVDDVIINATILNRLLTDYKGGDYD